MEVRTEKKLKLDIMTYRDKFKFVKDSSDHLVQLLSGL